MPNCNGCGAHVSQAYARVKGINGEVDECVECQNLSKL